MSRHDRGHRRGAGPVANTLVGAACIVSILLFHRSAESSGGAPASGGARPTRPPAAAVRAADVGAGPVDTDGVQRRLGPRDGTAVALTFDDGPDPRWTLRVLELLRRYRVRATFCLVGQHVAEHPELVRRIAADGHLLCDHSWSHDLALNRRGPAAVRAEIVRTYDAITAAAGARPRYFRAPGGRWNRLILAEARRLGLRPLGWSLDPRDWTVPPAAEISRQVRAARAGDIVLLHDGYGDRSATLAALPGILSALTRRGLTFTTP